MKTKSWLLSAALLAVVLCGVVMITYAQETTDASPNAAWSGHRHGGHMAYMSKALNLTDAQKEQVKSITQANRAANHPLMQQLTENHLAMLTATSSGAFDQAKVAALATQQAQLMAQMTVQEESIKHQIYTQVLTPDQRATADQMRQKQIARINEHLQKLSQPATETPGE